MKWLKYSIQFKLLNNSKNTYILPSYLLECDWSVTTAVSIVHNCIK